MLNTVKKSNETITEFESTLLFFLSKSTAGFQTRLSSYPEARITPSNGKYFFPKSINSSVVFSTIECAFNSLFLNYILLNEATSSNYIDLFKNISENPIEAFLGEFQLHHDMMMQIYNASFPVAFTIGENDFKNLKKNYAGKPNEFIKNYQSEVEILLTFCQFFCLINLSQFAYYLIYYLHHQVAFFSFIKLCLHLDVNNSLEASKNNVLNNFVSRTISLYKAGIASVVFNDNELAHINKCITT